MKQYNLTVNGQMLTYDGSVDKQPSHTVGYSFCHFNINGDEWDGTVKKAVFENRSSGDTLVVLLNSNNECEIPHEILEDSGQILVNLVGTILDADVVDYRITTGQVKLDREILVPIEGDNSTPPTPQEWETFFAPWEHPIATAESLDYGEQPTANVTEASGHKVFNFGIPSGRDGIDGQDGDDGFSPSASVTKVGGVATISITDKDGTTTAEIHDGEVTEAELTTALASKLSKGSATWGNLYGGE